MTAVPTGGTGRQTDIPVALPSPNDSCPTPSDSTSSPPSSTLHRGRPSNRYPDSLGRVPLHRRGKSKTYECLEDLLREAGYKETRIFTPETDRGNSMRGGVAAVVDFITGLVSRPGSSSLSCETAPLQDDSPQPTPHVWSPPPSPLAYAPQIKADRVERLSSAASLPHTGSSDSLRRRTFVGVSADASQRAHTYQVVPLHQSSQGLPHHPQLRHRAHHNSRCHHQLDNYSPKSSSATPNPTNARAYLRHMASAPNIQPLGKRAETSPRSHLIGREHRNGNGVPRHTFTLNDEDRIAEPDYEPHSRVSMDGDGHQMHPPLPRNWMESVARALISGVGGPAAVSSDAASTRTASTWKSSALSDKSNQERGRGPTRGAKPPLLCVQVQDMKAKTSQGTVACTTVVCRSTPTSRASSRARSSCDHTNAMKRRNDDKSGNSRRGKKDRKADILPSLARTKAENEDWMTPRQRYSAGWGMQGGAQAYPDAIWSDDSDDSADDDDDDDDEEELGLDRLLVPPRRQHSIQSLRKHLCVQRPSSLGFGGQGPSRPRTPGSGRASPFGNQGEDEDDYRPMFSSAEDRSNTRWRRGLPGLAQWTLS